MPERYLRISTRSARFELCVAHGVRFAPWKVVSIGALELTWLKRASLTPCATWTALDTRDLSRPGYPVFRLACRALALREMPPEARSVSSQRCAAALRDNTFFIESSPDMA